LEFDPEGQQTPGSPLIVLKRLARFWRAQSSAGVPAEPLAIEMPTLDGDLRAAGVSFAQWQSRRREYAATYANVSAADVAALQRDHSSRIQATLAAAERILGHQFNLLGSGPYVPLDSGRDQRDGYTPIDWYWDPVRKLRFPARVPYKQWNLFEMRPGNADVKYPWELGRCQHWVVLGQAFQISGNDRYAVEIARELDDFIEANPTGLGINWTCTMDVGLRAVSWVIAFDLIRRSAALDEAFWGRAYQALFDHGVFIRNNLENTYEVTSNHFLSNLLGLQFIGAVFGNLVQGAEWSSFARSAIEHEMTVQVLPDGADYESSVPYHRLVAELFLGAVRLADIQRAPLSPETRSRVRDMIAFLATVTRPDGLMPQIGDADDGRLHIFEGYGTTTPQDPRHLFGPAAIIYDEPSWLALGGDTARWEAAWWGLGHSSPAAGPAPIVPNRLFAHAGLAVVHSPRRDYLLITNGIVGTNGFGNHKHNDQLSFEYHRQGIPLIVDPGSYVYTSDGPARNLFRSTASHNTLSVDAVEQNDLRPDWLFRMFETSNAESVVFDDREDAVEYTGRHHGYERLDEPVTHERTMRIAKATGDLEIADRLSGRGRHMIRWHFHLAPDIGAALDDDGRVALTSGDRRWTLHLPAGLKPVIRPADYSPSYGVKIPCLAVDAAMECVLDGERRWLFSITE
jgi:hypothetical protein